MPLACDLLKQVLFAPHDMARSAAIRCRVGRSLILFAVLAGQIGLPNLSLSFATPAKPEPAVETIAAKCGCPPALRKVGRCCCATGQLPGARSCCAKPSKTESLAHAGCRVETKSKSASASATKPSPKQLTAYRDGCPCGQRDDTPMYRCADPRVVVIPVTASLDQLAPALVVLANDAPCGELLPPPLPPPIALRS